MSLATPQEVMQRLDEIEGQMAENQNELEDAARDYFTLRRERDVQRAKLLATTPKTGTVDDRKAQVLLQMENTDLWRAFVAAEGNYESLKLAQFSLRDRASIGQSILGFQKVIR